jgi:hypothetical protein
MDALDDRTTQNLTGSPCKSLSGFVPRNAMQNLNESNLNEKPCEGWVGTASRPKETFARLLF